MRKGNLLPTVFVFALGAIMLSGCGDNATAKTAKDTAPAVREERTEPVVTALPPEKVPQEDIWEDAASPPEEDVVEPTVDIDEIRHEYPNQNFYTYEEYVGTSWEEVNWQDINIIGPGPAGHLAKDEYGLPVQDEFWLADGSFDGVGYLLCCGAQEVIISPGFTNVYFGKIHDPWNSTPEEMPLLTIDYTSSKTVSRISFFNFSIATSSNTDQAISFHDLSKYPSQNHPTSASAVEQMRILIYAYKNCDLYATECPLDGMNLSHQAESRNDREFTCTEESMWQ